MRSTFVIFATALAFGAHAQAADEVPSLHALLIEAVQQGRAEGELVGPPADTFQRLFRTTAPLRLSARALHEVSAGCRRVEVTASQDGVWDRNSTRMVDRPEPRRLTFQVSICSDGTYPPPSPPRPAP